MAKVLEIEVVKSTAIEPTLRAVIKNKSMVCKLISPRSSLIATIAPFLALSSIYIVPIEISILAVLIPPVRTRKDSLLGSLISSLATIAA